MAQAWLLCQLMALDQADVMIAVGGRVSGRALTTYLTRAGYHVLFEEKDFPSDRMVEAAIQDAVLGADLFIALWSRAYAVSRFCFDEIELAVRRHQAGELELWLINLDGSTVVPPGARGLTPLTAGTPEALVSVVRDLLEPAAGDR